MAGRIGEDPVPTREKLENMMVRGEDIEQYFGQGEMCPPRTPPADTEIVSVNVDFTWLTIKELNQVSVSLNVKRQDVIKWLVRQGLDRLQEAEYTRRSCQDSGS